MSDPSISVVVPVYNAQRTLANCLEALLAQDYPDHLVQIIAVDNNSTDRSAQIARSYPLTFLERKDKQSSYAARNLGLQNATGDIVLFTDSDCVARPDWISKFLTVFDDPDVVGAGGRIDDAAPTNEVERFYCEVQPLRNGQKLAPDHYVSLVTANAAYRRTTLSEVGGFDERFETGGDISLSWRVQELGLGRICIVPNAVVVHHHRNTLNGMYRQFRRHGYGSMLLTRLHRDDPRYPQHANWQVTTMLSQLRALMTYMVSLGYRNTIGVFQRRSGYERRKPIYWFVAELGALNGRFRALRHTRCLRHDPPSTGGLV